MRTEKHSEYSLPWWGRLSFLYLLIAPLCLFIYALGLPITPNDYWYHVRAGFLQAQMGGIPTTNLMSAGVPLDHPYHYQSWISERVMYGLLTTIGLSGSIIFRAIWLALVWTIMVAAVYRRMRKVLSALNIDETDNSTIDKATAKYAALGGFVGLMLAFNNLDIRPQMFSYLFFAIFAFALFERPNDKAHRVLILLGLPLLMVVWANTHGAFMTGLIMIGVLCGGELLHAAWNFRANRSQNGPQMMGKFYGVLLVLCGAAAMVNPRGIGIYNYILKLSGNVASQRYIQEWQSPPGTRLHDWLFFISIALVLAGVVLVYWKKQSTQDDDRSKLNHTFAVWPSELLVLAGFAAMGLRDMRSIIWFGLWLALLAPPLVVAVRAARGKAVIAPAINTAPLRGAAVLNAAIAVILVLACIPFLPWYKHALPLPEKYLETFAPTPQASYPRGFNDEPPLLLDRETPVEAAAWIQQNPPRGRLFNDMVYGSYLTWALYPQTLPYSEPRVELYDLSYWEEYMRISGGPSDVSQWLQKHGFTLALIHPDSQEGLLKRLQTAPEWELIELNGPARLFRLKAS